MPSRYMRKKGDIEGMGLVFIEAQICGLPAIGTESGGIPETINRGRSGFLVREGDTSAIADRISLLFRDGTLRARMGRRGIIFVKNKFDWKKCVSKHLQFYANQP